MSNDVLILLKIYSVGDISLGLIYDVCFVVNTSSFFRKSVLGSFSVKELYFKEGNEGVGGGGEVLSLSFRCRRTLAGSSL